jgi:hypothetical protein
MSEPGWFSASLHLLTAVSNAITWPIATLVLAFVFRGSIQNLIGSVHSIEAKGVKLLLRQLPAASRAELKRLSSEDVWALESFVDEHSNVTKYVDKMNGAQRVAARTLLDLNLLTLVGEGSHRRATPTELGRVILETAKSLPL